jgi:EAL domain-containing protein (putative c-di-GMP-specific phosphodiesterase class I)
LSYLHQFPIDTLKVDRSFVTRMRSNGENSELVRTIVTLGQNLGLDVIAEGVETEEQLAQLRGMGCKYGQGYYFSKPLNSHEATGLISVEPFLANGEAGFHQTANLSTGGE